MPQTERCGKALRSLSDRRLPVGADFESCAELIEHFGAMDVESIPREYRADFEQLTVHQAKGFARYCRHFHRYLMKSESADMRFDFTDCALGNILFAGCFLEQGGDFNRAVEDFCAYYEVGPTLLNITQGENLFLVAEREDGSILRSEADIVSQAAAAKISRIALIDEQTYRGCVERAIGRSDRDLRAIIARGERIPEMNPSALQAIESADVIIYGPGTQHSSLLPSYVTSGIANAIAGNRRADKIFIANIRRDTDIQAENVNDLADKFLDSLRRSGPHPVEWRDVVTHFFVQRRDNASDESP